jgi:cell division protein FtsQ
MARQLAGFGLLSVAAAYGVYRVGKGVTHARVFRVDRIAISGTERLGKNEVLAALSGLRGESVVWIDLERWRQRLLDVPWIREATLRRSLPATVDIVIVERQPVGIGRLNGDMYLVDDHGTLIDRYGPQYADLDLPIIDGLGAGGDEADGRSELVARLVSAVRARPQLARRVSQIDVSDAHNASIILTGDPAVLYVGEDRFVPRLQSYIELASTLRERTEDIDYVDLRFDDRIYIGPHHDARSTVKRGRDGVKPSQGAAIGR